jgi:hypothetical protein
VPNGLFIIFEKRLSAAIPHFIISASGGFDILRFAVQTPAENHEEN